jgi:hypothetical protein
MLGENAARVTCGWPVGHRGMAGRIVFTLHSKFVPEEDTSSGCMQTKRSCLLCFLEVTWKRCSLNLSRSYKVDKSKLFYSQIRMQCTAEGWSEGGAAAVVIQIDVGQ